MHKSNISSEKSTSPQFIQQNISLADKNWFETGGPARYFCEPKNAQEFQAALAYADEHNMPIFVLGQGANILISDDGFAGLVIRPQMTAITVAPYDDTHALVTAGAGVTMHDLILYCLDNNIIGLEEFSGIPGTVGGSVYINLHYFQFLLAEFLVAATIIDKQTGATRTVSPDWLAFGYDYSTLHSQQQYLLNATFKLKRCTQQQAAYARGRHVEIIRHRHARYPYTRTCGSFFRNFHDNEVTLVQNNKKMIYVAYYLDTVGVRGSLSAGNASVSYQHANMLVTQPGATSSDIIALARAMQTRVQQQFGIIPQPECQLIGFAIYPLL